MVRLASEQIANNLGAAEMLSGPCVDAARIIERHLSPVVLAAEAAAIEEHIQYVLGLSWLTLDLRQRYIKDLRARLTPSRKSALEAKMLEARIDESEWWLVKWDKSTKAAGEYITDMESQLGLASEGER